MKQPKQNTGFTLIELLVVMAILVLLSSVSYKAIVTALQTREASTAYQKRLRELELGLFLLTKDLHQIHQAPLPSKQRPLTANFGHQEKPKGELFQLFRSADAALLQGVVSVRYRIENQQLIQILENDTQVFQTPLLNQILSARIFFYDTLGRRFSTWHQPELPQVIEIRLRHQFYGELVIKEVLNG